MRRFRLPSVIFVQDVKLCNAPVTFGSAGGLLGQMRDLGQSQQLGLCLKTPLAQKVLNLASKVKGPHVMGAGSPAGGASGDPARLFLLWSLTLWAAGRIVASSKALSPSPHPFHRHCTKELHYAS